MADENKTKEKETKKTVESAAVNSASLIAKATIEIIKSFADETLEYIRKVADMAMIDIEASSKLSQRNADLVTATVSKSLDAALKSYTGSITESAYAAANNAIELSAQKRKLELETSEIELHRQLSKDVREEENKAELRNLGARRKEAFVALMGDISRQFAETLNDIEVGGEVAGFGLEGSTGKAPGETADLVAQFADAAMAANSQIIRSGGEIAVLSEKSIQNISETTLEAQNAVEKAWIELAADIRKQWLAVAQQTESLLEKADSAAISAGKSIGKNEISMESYRKTLFESQIALSKWNKDMADMQKMQEGYAEGTGRNIEMNLEDFNKSFALGSLIGDEVALELTSQMDYFNKSVADSSEIFFEMYDKANKVGISNRKYAKELNQNLKIAQKYTFKGGVKAMMEMSIWAQKTRFNMQNLETLVDKIQDGGLEGVITQGAKLQVLGGNMAMGADPIAMMYEAWADPEALAKRFSDMTKGMGHFNKKTGEVEIAGTDAMRLKAYAEATGMDYKDARAMITQRVKGEQIDRSLTKNYTDEEKALLYTKAQMGDDGQWYVTVNGNKRNVNDLDTNDFTELLPHEEKLEKYAEGLLDKVTEIAAATKEQQSVTENETLGTWSEEVDKRIAVTLSKFYSDLDDFVNHVDNAMKFATTQQKTAFDIAENAENVNDGVKKASEDIENNSKMIAESLVSANNVITNALKEISNVSEEAIKEIRQKKEDSIFTKADEALNLVFGDNYKKAADGSSFSETMTDIFDNVFPIQNVGFRGILDAVKTVTGQRSVSEGISDVFNDMLRTMSPLTRWAENISKRAFDDGVINGNGTSTIISPADNVTKVEDGMSNFVQSDKNDSALFAKTGGPFDKLFNGVFNRINDVYGQIVAKNNGLSAVRPYYTGLSAMANDSSVVKFDTLKVEINGNLDLKSGDTHFNIADEIRNNPLFIRSLSQMLAEHVSGAINGGRGAFPLSYGSV